MHQSILTAGLFIPLVPYWCRAMAKSLLEDAMTAAYDGDADLVESKCSRIKEMANVH